MPTELEIAAAEKAARTAAPGMGGFSAKAIAKAALEAAEAQRRAGAPSDDTTEYLIETIQEERDSALRNLVEVLAFKKSTVDAAWWLCANHAKFVIDHPNLISEATLIDMARRAGSPPKGESWEQWFERVRDLKPHDVLQR